VSTDTRLGRRMSSREFIIGSSRRRLRAKGVRFRPGVADAHGCTVRLADGSSLDPGIVVWATGYRSDYSWIDIPGVTHDGQVIHRRGVTEIPGLYFLGLPWQHTRGSALLGFVHDDAAYLASRINTTASAAKLPPNLRLSRRREPFRRHSTAPRLAASKGPHAPPPPLSRLGGMRSVLLGLA
jgi:putative flavoprotein involved in K+ transport